MSIWTNSAAAALACAGLSACAGLELVAHSRSVSVLGGAVNVAPPAGYCADPKVSKDGGGKDGGDSAVVLMGRCSAASGATPALITASIGAGGSGAALDAGPVALTSFFTSDQGRGMLAASGRASDAVVNASETEGSSILLLVKDATLGTYWRAILALKGRLVMLSATGVDRDSLPPADGRALLSKSMAALQRANAEKEPSAKTGGLFGALGLAPGPNPAQAAAPTGLRPLPRPSVPTSG